MMENDTQPPTSYPATLRLKWAKAFIIVWIVSSVSYGLLIGPIVEQASYASGAIFLPLGWWAPIGMLAPSLSLSLLFAIFALQHRPKRIVFRPTRARVIGCGLFYLILPLGMISLLPVSAGFVMVGLLTRFDRLSDKLVAVFALLGLLAGCYAMACILSVGLQNKWRRGMAYILIWSGCLWLVFAVGSTQWFVL